MGLGGVVDDSRTCAIERIGVSLLGGQIFISEASQCQQGKDSCKEDGPYHFHSSPVRLRHLNGLGECRLGLCV